MDREKFIQALSAEGIPCSTGYGTLTKDAYVRNLAQNRHYLQVYGEKRMQQWLEQLSCPVNDKLCEEEALWFYQTMLLGSKSDMEKIAEAIRKISREAKAISKL